MIRLFLSIGVAVVSGPALAAKPCEELKAEIATRLTEKGVSGFQLDVIAAAEAGERIVVGSCEGGEKKILYTREGAPAPGPAAPVIAPQVSSMSKPSPSLARPVPAEVRPVPKLRNAANTFRDRLDEGGEGPSMIVIPAGDFVMGSQLAGLDRRYRENPEHRVSVRSFALARTEMTFDDYDRFAKATKRPLPADDGQGRGARPVVNVSWSDAHAYTQWLSVRTGFAYRLPSEAEWEYAARARGKPGAAYGTGDCISGRQANFNDVSGTTFNNCPASNISLGKSQSVASYPANAFGLYDMHGNVFEWTADCLHLDYEKAPSDASAWLREPDGNCGERMVRGGSWQSGQVSVRSALRAAIGFSDASGLIGFRVARDLPATQ